MDKYIFIRKFLDKYINIVGIQKKVNLINKLLIEYTKENKYIEEILFLHGFTNLLNENFDEAEACFDEKAYENKKILAKLGNGILKTNIAEKSYNQDVAKEAVDALEEVIKNEEFMLPFIYYKLSKAYILLGSLSAPQVPKDSKEDINYYDSAITLLIKILSSERYRDNYNIGYINNALGSVYWKDNQFEKAKECYNETLRLNPKSKTLCAYAHNGLGNVYREQRNYSEAINEYNTSIDYSKDFFYPHHYLGDCYTMIEKHELAEKEYLEAIKINPNHVFPVYGLGRLYYELGNRHYGNIEYYKNALKYLKSAITLNEHFPYSFLDCARVYEKLGNLLKEKKSYEQAKKFYEQAKDRFLVFSSKGFWKHEIDDIIEKINKKAVEKGSLEEELKKYRTIEQKILCATDLSGIESASLVNEESFISNFLREKLYTDDNINNNNPTVTIDILQRWNSFTPVFLNNSRGGGYFINAFGRGIVIDPGYDFVKNFVESGYKFYDIDIILVTHAHDDHTACLESILSLLYKYNKALKDKKIPRMIAKENHVSTKTVTEKEIERFEENRAKKYEEYKKSLLLFLSKNVLEKYSGVFKANNNNDFIKYKIINKITNDNNRIKNCTCIIKTFDVDEKIETFKIKNYEYIPGDLYIKAIMAKHDDVIKKDNCLGFIISFGQVVLVYTGDTSWNTNIEKYYRDEVKNLIKDKYCILLAHLGGFSKGENKLLDDTDFAATDAMDIDCDKIDNSIYKKNHLGRLGLARISRLLNPDICIVSEFGEEFSGLRIDVAKIYNQIFEMERENKSGNSDKIKTIFLPADIGLKLIHQLNSDVKECVKIKAVTAIDRLNKKIIYSHIAPEKIAVGELRANNTLFYYEKDSGLEEKECMQALFENYKEIDRTEIFKDLDI